MEDHAADAARTIVNGLEDPDPRVRQASANSILDRMGEPYGFAGSYASLRNGLSAGSFPP